MGLVPKSAQYQEVESNKKQSGLPLFLEADGLGDRLLALTLARLVRLDQECSILSIKLYIVNG